VSLSVDPDEEVSFFPIPDWQRRILDERLADIERHPNDEQSWEEIKVDLWSTGDRDSA
jgi:hypothetical protein